MPRYIDADKLLTKVVAVSNSTGQVTWSAVSALDILTAPTVDSEEVVRCRECKHYETEIFDGDILCGCTLRSAMLDITPDSFCSYGERKEGADND